jgi:hypothetical protein
VLTRDTLAYRKLTDRPEPDSADSATTDGSKELTCFKELSKGNGAHLPHFSIACVPVRAQSKLQRSIGVSESQTVPHSGELIRVGVPLTDNMLCLRHVHKIDTVNKGQFTINLPYLYRHLKCNDRIFF